jgi:hypothetical protein
MCETTIMVDAGGHIRGVRSWTMGFKALKCPHKAASEDAVLEFAVRLERRGLHDEAESLLDRYLSGFRVELV